MMHRPVAWLACISICALMTLRPAFAQAPGNGDWHTQTSPEGYQLQVSTDWHQGPVDVAGVPATGFQSPDGTGAAFVTVAPIPQDRVGDPSQLLQDFTKGVNIGAAQDGGSEANVFQGPNTILITGADSGYALTEIEADANGNRTVMGVRLAIQGSLAFVLVVGGPESFYTSDPSFGGILDSFQLTQPSPASNIIPGLKYEASGSPSWWSWPGQ